MITALRGVWAWVTCDVYVAEVAGRGLISGSRDGHAPSGEHVPKHRADCTTCFDAGLVGWEPFAHRDSEEDQQPCPDCCPREGRVR